MDNKTEWSFPLTEEWREVEASQGSLLVKSLIVERTSCFSSWFYRAERYHNLVGRRMGKDKNIFKKVKLHVQVSRFLGLNAFPCHVPHGSVGILGQDFRVPLSPELQLQFWHFHALQEACTFQTTATVSKIFDIFSDLVLLPPGLHPWKACLSGLPLVGWLWVWAAPASTLDTRAQGPRLPADLLTQKPASRAQPSLGWRLARGSLRQSLGIAIRVHREVGLKK